MKIKLDDILARLGQHYDAQPTTTVLAPGALEKIAEHLRQRSALAPSYDVLREGLACQFQAPAPAPARGSTELHKIAHAVRIADAQERQAAYDDTYNTLCAARAITLLRERMP